MKKQKEKRIEIRKILREFWRCEEISGAYHNCFFPDRKKTNKIIDKLEIVLEEKK